MHQQLLRHALVLAAMVAASAVAAPVVSAAVATGLVCASCVDSSDVKNSAITTADIKNSTIGGADVRDGGLGANDLAADSVAASEVASGAIGVDELAASAVTASELASGSVTAPALASGSVTAAALATDAINASAIAAGAVGSSELADGSVALGDVAFDPVTETELETEIDGFNASAASMHDVPSVSLTSTTMVVSFGLADNNFDGATSITVPRDVRLLVAGTVTIEGAISPDPVACQAYLDSAAFPPAAIGPESQATLTDNQTLTLPISASATVSSGTYDVHVRCRKLSDAGGGSVTTAGYLNVWTAEQ